MGLRLRILLVFLLVAGISTATVVAGIILPMMGQYKHVNAELATTSLQSAQLASHYLEARINEAQNRLRLLAGHEYLTYRDNPQACALLHRLSVQALGSPRLVAFDEAGQPVAWSEPLKGASLSDWPLVKFARTRNGFVFSDRLTWPGDHQPTIALAMRYRYYDRAGSHWGVVLEASDLAAWNAGLNQSTQRVEIFDRKGAPLIPLSLSPPVSSARSEVRDALAGHTGTRQDDNRAVIAYAGVPAVGWAVVAIAPAAESLLPISRAINLAARYGLLSMLLAGVLSFVLSGFLVAPIRRLEAGAAALARGEWNAGAASALLPTERSDELGALAKSFAQMVRQLRERFESIEALVAQRTRELEATNSQLRVAISELKELDELKRSFLDAISHELRTPLNFIMGFGSGLEDGLFGELSEEQAHAMRRIMEGSDRLLGVVNDLIEVSKLEAGQLALVPQALDLSELLEFAGEQAGLTYSDRLHTYAVELDPELPPVYADPERVGQILRQLLSNAAKFTEPGGRIVLAARTVGERVEVEVRDTGIGIAPDVLPHIWDSFRQGDGSMTRKHGGTGVGLTIVRRLIEAMGEEVTVLSTPGEGSCFRFTLPVAHFDEHGNPDPAERRVPQAIASQETTT